jgi:hypothetical protein
MINLANNNVEVKHSRELGLTILAIVVAGASVNFLILGTAGMAPFLEYRNYVLIPSLFIILFIAVYGYRKNKRLANRLITGLWIGLVATLALEAVRIPSIYAHLIPHDDMIALPGNLLVKPPTIDQFKSMTSPHGTTGVPNASSASTKDDGHNDKMDDNMDDSPKGSSGTMMKDSMQESPLELVIGGLYHYWNGATMAAVYTLVMGKGRWYYGLVWGFIIHIGMMLAPWMLSMVGPFGIDYKPSYSIFMASLLAHLAYGAVIGILVQRFVKDKESLVNIIKVGRASSMRY